MKSKISEADVQRAVVDLLTLDGWRAIRTDPVSDRARGKGFGEFGMPDYLFIRYDLEPLPSTLHRDEKGREMCWCADFMLWIEFKRPGAKPKPHQAAWHDAERARGALVLVVDDIDKFRDWYAQSGLRRRI